MKPLHGLRIVELPDPAGPLAQRIAGAFAGRMLADLGATVVFREPPGGDPLRRVPPAIGGTSALFAFLTAGKTLSAEPETSLLETADAAILGTSPSYAAPHGPALKAIARLSLLGEAQRDVPASEFTVMALSGVLDIVGDPARAPLRLGGHQAAYSAGLAAFTGLLAMLCRPQATVQTVSVSLLETMLWINWKSAVAEKAPTRSGKAAEWQTLRCADGWLALVYQPEDWPALRALADDARLDAPQFATHASRLENSRDLAAILEFALMRFTREELRAEAIARRLPLGPVWNLHELLDDRHYTDRAVFAPANLPDGSIAPMIRLPLTWNGACFAPGAVPASPMAAPA